MSAETTIIKTLMHTLIEVGLVAGYAEKLASRDSEYTGAAIPYSLAVIQQLAAVALQDVSNIMRADIVTAGGEE
ncbi:MULTISPECIES: hypothetical protein [Morganella]|uniref:hypothetical protein n=1 Tax=Morganella TaxID=581 RepID=UPI0021D21FB5|nr:MULTISPECIES: hypothetical protein [Morganella]MCU6377632.1 hypothetical protein [Morganella morganii]MDH0353592.1 hypothetical protein [Morganella sp. GD04133]